MKTITNFIGFLALADMAIVMLTMANIATGKMVYHVPFFDEQIRLLISLIS